MPAVPGNSKVLVTGANGFLAVWVVKALLERGYTVLGTVRSPSKGTHLKKIFEAFGDKFQLVVVKDITAEGAFDDLVEGVDAIAHTASPFHFAAEDPQEILHPAINGTLSVLKSALKNGPGVKRIVITSSCAAVLSDFPEPKVFTELDWNEQAIDDIKKNGKDATNSNKYMASKTLAERAAWNFVTDNKAQISWDLTTLQPPYIFGPILQEISKPEDLNTSSKMFWETTLPTANHSTEYLTEPRGGWIDVRDIALAHVLALEKESAGGERFIISAGSWTYQDFLDVSNALSPQPLKRDLPKGIVGSGKNVTHKLLYDTSKMKRVLGLEPTPIETMIRDILQIFAERNW
jgi:nucleoside-diphosphate-sugar epimerase